MTDAPSSSSILTAPSCNMTVVLRINDGDFSSGFGVTLQILDTGQIIQEDDSFLRLPSAPMIPVLFEEWQKIFRQGSRTLQRALDTQTDCQQDLRGQLLSSGTVYASNLQDDRQVDIPPQVTNVAGWQRATSQLEHQCRQWFASLPFMHLGDRIQANRRVQADDSIPIIIRCQTGNNEQDNMLAKLPWQIWTNDIANAEFALFGNFRQIAPPLSCPVKILAIWGNAKGLSLKKDAEALALLKQRGADIRQLSEPSFKELSDLLLDEPWDILFFAGHSSGESESGSIQLSAKTTIQLGELRTPLREAKRYQGLRLAIFNSCDGLNIAQFLANDVGIPVSIVMRQPVPDQVAGEFLLEFLREFSTGTALSRSVRLARVRLKWLEQYFPSATWLPTVCVNPNQPEFVWPFHPPEIAMPDDGEEDEDRREIVSETPTEPEVDRKKQWRVIVGGIVLIMLVGLVGVVVRHFINRSSSASGQDNIDAFISKGKNIVKDTLIDLNDDYLRFKQEGINALGADNYQVALQSFDAFRQRATREKFSNNPAIAPSAMAALQDYESLIYRNNALSLNRHQQDKTPLYTIAVAAPLNVDAGVDIAYGVAQKQDILVNQQQMNLVVAIANDNNTEAQAQQVAKALANDEDILAVVGHYTSPNSCAALREYSPEHLVLVAPTSTTVNLQSNPDCGGNANQVFFRTVSTTRVEAQTLVEYLIEDLQITQPNVAVFSNEQELFSRNLGDQFIQVIQAFGGTVTRHDLSDVNLNPERLPLVVENADALAILPDGGTNDQNAFNRAVKIVQRNNGEKPILGANTLYRQSVLNGSALHVLEDRLFIAVDWHKNQCGTEPFVQEIRQYWGGDLNRRTALAYEAMEAIAQSIQLAEVSGQPVTRQSIRQKLADTGIRPETAAKSAIFSNTLISFDPIGDRKEITTRLIVTIDESNGQRDFVLARDVDCNENL